MYIRRAEARDVSRIGEILVFNNRISFFPIFKDESYSFGEMQVINIAEEYLKDERLMNSTWVYDDGVVRGLIRIEDGEIVKLFVDPFFQRRGIGAKLLEFAVKIHHANRLWALEKNERAIRFYERHGFYLTGEKMFEEDTTEYLVRLERQSLV